jgi:hypothetical protein
MNDKVATYTFLPWLRQGIASHIDTQDTLGELSGLDERAEVTVSLRVNEGSPIAKNILLIGPGDILGINPRAIVKTEPRNWITDFEPNYLPFIEFYDEDFPWRYTPANAVHTGGDDKKSRLRPWIVLVVLTEDEFEPLQPLNGTLPSIKIIGDINTVFPKKPGQSWAWAHVHVSKDITRASGNTPPQMITELESLVRQNPDEAYSRLICPRKLQPNKAYHAFVVPAFETGRRAGLGLDTGGIDALKPSWGDNQLEFPVYYQWYFRTGERGGFEFLVRLLEPRPVDDRVGIRDMDMQKPEFEVKGMSDPNVVGLEGALKKPGSKSRPETWPPDPPPEFMTGLQEKVNLQQVAEESGSVDPVISPPLYGRWYARVQKMNFNDTGWVNELNRDPRNRVSAGLGTKVIQTHQEKYMQKAWQQLGEGLKANQKIRQIQLSISASFQIYKKNLLHLTADQLIAMTRGVHPRIMGSPTTIYQQIKDSKLPLASTLPSFRKITRPRGVIARKSLPERRSKPADILTRLNVGKITAAPPKRVPENQIALNEIAEQLLPSWMPEWLRELLRDPYFRWILLGLSLLVFVSGIFTGFGLLNVILLAALGGSSAFFMRYRREAEASVAFTEDNLTAGAVDDIPVRTNFEITEAGSAPPAGTVVGTPGTDSIEAANFRVALRDMHAVLEADIPKPKPGPKLDFERTALTLTRALNPVTVLSKRVRTIVAIPPAFKFFRPFETIVPLMAHPVFSDPMYEPLRDISSELLMPNLNLIPNNTISLLETNQPFIESYMVGVNHEMGRELLWREYPTDQRGSYFRQFWNVGDVVNRDPGKTPQQLEEELRDIAPLHTWHKKTELGTHENRILPGGSESEPDGARLVLVIKGDVLKKYPTAVIHAQKARWGKDNEDNDEEGNDEEGKDVRLLDESAPAQNIQEPLFKAGIEPDITFLGFNLTASQVKGSRDIDKDPGWFFVIRQRPGEPRFGLDNKRENTPVTATKWNDLAWEHLENFDTLNYIDLDAGVNVSIADGADNPDSGIKWGMNAADMAYILYQAPVMAAFHGEDMLE